MHNPVRDLLRIKPRKASSWMTAIRRGTFHYPTYRRVSHTNYGTLLNALDYAGQLPYLKVVTYPIGLCLVANYFSGLLICALVVHQVDKVKSRNKGNKREIS